LSRDQKYTHLQVVRLSLEGSLVDKRKRWWRGKENCHYYSIIIMCLHTALVVVMLALPESSRSSTLSKLPARAARR